MIVLLNNNACGGKANEKWKTIESEMHRRFNHFDIINTNSSTDEIIYCLERGEKKFVAVGGDGTVNFLLNTLVENISQKELKQVQIGAIGLGSSNDFHKPFIREKFINNIPCRLNFSKTFYHDLGIVRFTENTNHESVKYWINNASIGVTAEANYLFSHPGNVLRLLKRNNTNAAILYAAVKTIFQYEKCRANLTSDFTNASQIELTNLGIVKNPHFSGSFCYDSPYNRNNGKFFIHICERMTTLQTLQLLYYLSKKIFSTLDNTISLECEHVMVESKNSFAVEYDGETIRTNKAQFSLIKDVVQLCS